MPSVHLVGFRGTGGFKNPKYQNEPALIKAGNIGIQFENESNIYGFHLTSKALLEAGDEDQVIHLLKEHIRQEGCLQEDSIIFNRADKLSESGERTEVVYLTYEFEQEEYNRIRQTTQSWFEEQKVFWYNFPSVDGNFEPDEDN